jgi:hypothetical protein
MWWRRFRWRCLLADPHSNLPFERRTLTPERVSYTDVHSGNVKVGVGCCAHETKSGRLGRRPLQRRAWSESTALKCVRPLWPDIAAVEGESLRGVGCGR